MRTRLPMITKLIDYIKKEICSCDLSGSRSQVSVLHLDIYRARNERALLFVFEGRERYPRYVAKYVKHRDFERDLYNEFTNYTLLYNKVSSRVKSSMPKPICLYDKGSTLAAIERGVPGESIASLIDHNASSRKILRYIEAAFDFLSLFQNETKKECKFDDIERQKLIGRPVTLFCETFQLSRAKRALIEKIKDDVVNYLVDQSQLFSCHGDYWPKNIVAHRNKVYVIDWPLYMEAYLGFWDYCTLIFNTRVKSRIRRLRLEEMKRGYMRGLGIYPDIEREINLIYLAIRTIWHKYRHGMANEWDRRWKVLFDRELCSYEVSRRGKSVA
jgi:hypothetical protein